MDTLLIRGAKHKYHSFPSISFDPDTRICSIEGESFLEDATKFYAPVYEWLSLYAKEGKGNLHVDFKLSYFNTSSSKCILQVLDLLKEISKKHQVDIFWYYYKSDEDMVEEVEDFMADTGLKINMVVIDD